LNPKRKPNIGPSFPDELGVNYFPDNERALAHATYGFQPPSRMIKPGFNARMNSTLQG
jgi:hypothetical protein